jgi:hypothetical protein
VAAKDERRDQERVALQCPVTILTPLGGAWGEAMTVNMSSQGIYWISQLPFTPGLQVQCSIAIGAQGLRSEAEPIFLACRVRVVRVESTGEGVGVGCRIEQYSLCRGHRWKLVADDTSELHRGTAPAL